MPSYRLPVEFVVQSAAEDTRARDRGADKLKESQLEFKGKFPIDFFIAIDFVVSDSVFQVLSVCVYLWFRE